jgi:hypothetical protein
MLQGVINQLRAMSKATPGVRLEGAPTTGTSSQSPGEPFARGYRPLLGEQQSLHVVEAERRLRVVKTRSLVKMPMFYRAASRMTAMRQVRQFQSFRRNIFNRAPEKQHSDRKNILACQ